MALVGLSPRGQSEAQDGLAKRDAQGPVTVVVTLIPATAPGVPIKAKVVPDTHSVALDGALAIRTSDEAEVLLTAVERARGGSHHREAVVVFPPPAQPGPVRTAPATKSSGRRDRSSLVHRAISTLVA